MRFSPIIILGMHRSGTTMLSKLLEQLGIFMGWRKEENNEALFFLKFNDWILEQVNATWDNPYNYRFVDESFKDLIASLAEKYIKSIRRIEYLGFKKALKYKSLKELDFAWGWKDPRNTFTVDIWLRIFPKAKLIHIYRNPIDVAESLRKRTFKYRENFRWNFENRLKFFLLKGSIGYGNSVRVMNIYEGIQLWNEYVSRVFELEKCYELNILHIKYENFLENPLPDIKKILFMANLNYDINRVSDVIKNIDVKRKYAFLLNKELVDIYKAIKKDKNLIQLGYDNII